MLVWHGESQSTDAENTIFSLVEKMDCEPAVERDHHLTAGIGLNQPALDGWK